MDKITFESVMEEIKKSLGEARLMSIEEAMGAGEDYPEGTKPEDKPNAKKPEDQPSPTQDNSKSAMMQRDMDSNKPATPAPAPKPVTPSAPAASVAAPAPQVPASQKAQGKGPDAIPASLKAQGKTPGVSPPATSDGGGDGGGSGAKPAAKPSAPAARPTAPSTTKVDTAAIYAKHGVGSSGEDAGAFHRAEAEISAARKSSAGTTPAAPAAKPAVSAPAAPGTKPSMSLGNLGKGETSMSDREVRSANMQAVANRVEKTPAPPKPVAPSTNSPGDFAKVETDAIQSDSSSRLAQKRGDTSLRQKLFTKKSVVSENYDQFVKKFLKESK